MAIDCELALWRMVYSSVVVAHGVLLALVPVVTHGLMLGLAFVNLMTDRMGAARWTPLNADDAAINTRALCLAIMDRREGEQDAKGEGGER